MARNCKVSPASTVGLSGLTLTEVTVGALIVSVAVALLPLSAAVIVADPAATPLASPEPDWIVTFVVSEEVQVTEVVILPVEASLYVPVAVNCWLAPTPIERLAGVTAIEVRVREGVVGAGVPPPQPV